MQVTASALIGGTEEISQSLLRDSMKTVPLRSEKREEKKRKKRYGPQGAGFAAQAKRATVNKGYAGVPKALKPRVKNKTA